MFTPYGTWPSPISAALVADQGLRLSAVTLDGADIYWLEGRPAEGGRNVLVRRTAAGAANDVIPVGFNVRTRVHEYGGGAFVVHRGIVYFSNFSDQRIYGLDREPGSTPEPITPEGAWFYADVIADERRQRLICVREDHSIADREPVTTLVSVPIESQRGSGPRGSVAVIASGYDFYSTPCISPDGSTLSWLCWNHPQMPWDGTELWVAGVASDGALESARRVAGGPTESIYQPGWSPDGALYFVSDCSGWWQLYRADLSDGRVVPVLRNPPAGAEFGRPQWVLGAQTWVFADPSRIVASYATAGRWRLATIDVPTGTLSDVATHLEPHEWLAADSAHAMLVASSSRTPASVVRINLETGTTETLRATSTAAVGPEYISVPESIEYVTSGNLTSHAFYYPPRNRDAAAADDDRPPLIAISHGGPTTASSATLDLRVQFWTSRGFAVVDVNYGGSSGYGRAYRERLKGQWGIVDVEDMINAVGHLVRQGKADPERLIIRGGSAGGYTTLAALTFYGGVFKAGASYYGVSDIELLARDTHKFESRYLDTLVGPYPERREEYQKRSPIHFVDRLSCALIFFQGLEDRVVPPNQSETMADAVRRKGLPVAYLTFEGEQHGFRKAETISRCLESELFFYGAVFGFEPADRLAPVHIDNCGFD
jgi:dipeptidyl aminopeptidase/acylaminoacyl peptidase